MSSGRHHLKFTFGSDVEFAHSTVPRSAFVDGVKIPADAESPGTTSLPASSSTTTCTTTRELASSTPSQFGPGTNLIIAPVQFITEQSGGKTVKALLYRGSTLLTETAFDIEVDKSNRQNSYTLLAQDNAAGAEPTYSVKACVTSGSAPLKVKGEAKIMDLSGVINSAYVDGNVTTLVEDGQDVRIVSTGRTDLEAGNNIIFAQVQLSNEGTPDTFPVGSIKIRNYTGHVLASNQYPIDLANATSPFNVRSILIIAKESGFKQPTYSVDVEEPSSQAKAEAKIMVLQTAQSAYKDGGIISVDNSLTNLVTLPTTFPVGSEVFVVATGQFDDSNSGSEKISAGDFQLTATSGTESVNTITNQFIMQSLGGASSGDDFAHTLMYRTTNSPANPEYKLDVTRTSGSGLKGEGKIIAFRVNNNVPPAPTIISLIASDTNGGTDTGYSDSDTITVRFSNATNQPPVSTKAQLDDLFSFSQNLGTIYNGTWATNSLLVINMTDVGGATPPAVGSLTLTLRNNTVQLRNSAGTSSSSADTSPLLSGSFGAPAPPFIESVVATDPTPTNNRADKGYSDGDTITLRFSQSTNAPGQTQTRPSGGNAYSFAQKADVDALFTFTANRNGSTVILGQDYEGKWINPSTFVIDIIDAQSTRPPVVGNLIVTPRTNTFQIKNLEETSASSTSRSPPLTGSFENSQTSSRVLEGGRLSAILPSGTASELGLPKNVTDIVQIAATTAPGRFDGLSPQVIRFIGDVADITPNNADTCESGCTVEFKFTQEDLDAAGLSINEVLFLHDANEDGTLSANDPAEKLSFTITRNGDGSYTVTATVNSNSKFAIGGIKTLFLGGFYDKKAPTIQGTTFSGTTILTAGGVLESADGSTLPKSDESDNVKWKAITGGPIKLQISATDNEGASAIKHVGIYTNVRGSTSDVSHSDTYIVYEKDTPMQVIDPNGFFSNVNVVPVIVDNKLELTLELTFKETMERSDIIIRTWDDSKNTYDTQIINAIEVVKYEIMPFEESTESLEFGGILELEEFHSVQTENTYLEIFDVKSKLGNSKNTITPTSYVNNESLLVSAIVNSHSSIKDAEIRFIQDQKLDEYNTVKMDVKQLVELSDTIYSISATIPRDMMPEYALLYWIHVSNEDGLTQDSSMHEIGVAPHYPIKGTLELDTEAYITEGNIAKLDAYFTNQANMPLYGTISLVVDGNVVYTSPPQTFVDSAKVNLEWKVPSVNELMPHELQAKAEFYDTFIETMPIAIHVSPQSDTLSSKLIQINEILDQYGNTVANPISIYSSILNNANARYTVTAPDNTCIIGSSYECLVRESTTGQLDNLKSITMGDQIFRVRYSGPDSPLERFSITSVDAIAGQWKIGIESQDGTILEPNDDVLIKVNYETNKLMLKTSST